MEVGHGTGITPLKVEAGKIIVGFDFAHFNQEAPKQIMYRGKIYFRDMLEFMDPRDSSLFCSVRGYIENHKTIGIQKC